MNSINHKDMLDIGETVSPLGMRRMKQLVDRQVDECYGQYRLKGTPNSADLSFVRIDSCGYIDLRFNPRWIHQFQPSEWPEIEERLDQSPFVRHFGDGQYKLLSQKNWDRHFKTRFEKR